jgi:hypothetical protein
VDLLDGVSTSPTSLMTSSPAKLPDADDVNDAFSARAA